MERMSAEEFKKLKVKKSKYGNTKTIYKGEKYDSKKEADYARDLDTARSANSPRFRVVKVERQIPFRINVEGIKICTYIADFVVKYQDGHEEIIDVKGFRTEVYKIKKKLVEALFKIKIIEI